jgi:hypothetical protein
VARRDSKMTNQAMIQSLPGLSRDELEFISAVLAGIPISTAMDNSGLIGSTARSALVRAAKMLESSSLNFGGAQAGKAVQPTLEADLDLLYRAFSILPLQTVLLLAARHCRRLLPFVPEFLNRFPDSHERFRDVRQALLFAEEYVQRKPEKSGIDAILARIKEARLGPNDSLGDEEKTAADTCLDGVRGCLDIVSSEGDKMDMFSLIKQSQDFTPGIDSLTATAIDARTFLALGLDQDEDLSRIRVLWPLFRVSQLWPSGEPEWYRARVEKMNESRPAAPLPSSPREVSTGSYSPPVRVYIPPLAFLRTMWVILFNALRNPSRKIVVDLSKGEVIRNP